MRPIPVVAAALLLAFSGSAFAEEWIEFVSREDRFTCNFPTQPKVTPTTYKSEYGADLPARVYAAGVGSSRYSMTVVDYNYSEKLLGGIKGGGVERWKQDIAGAITYATGQLVQRDVKVTLLISGWMDWVEGHHLQFTSNADKSRTYASIYMHENKLYIMEGTVPPGSPEPALFQQSLGWIDENGIGIRYQAIYRNGYPAPPRVNRAGRGAGQAGQAR